MITLDILPYDYILPRMQKKAASRNFHLDIKIAAAMDRSNPRESWQPLYDWFDHMGMTSRVWTWSPFSSDDRRFLGFSEVHDAMLFKLAWS